MRTAWIVRSGLMALALGTLTGQAAAQHIINLSAGGADRAYTGAADSRAGTYLDQGTLGGGDSRRDLVIGAPGTATGRVYMIFGRPGGPSAPLDTYADAIITGPGSFGTSTAVGNITMTASGVVRNLAVGAPDASSGRGRVYVFTRDFQGGDRLTEATAVAVITGAPNDRIGAALATADLNNDGYRELIIGAPGTDRIYILYGGPAFASRNLEDGADSMIVGHPSNNAGIGNVLLGGPITSDNIYDVAIGEPAANSVYLIAGTNGALPARIDLPASGAGVAPAGVTAMFVGADPGDEAGTTLVVADIDGNGAMELLVGAPGGDGRNNNAPDTGEVYSVWNEHTHMSGSLAQAGVIFYGGQSNQRLGSVFQKGDINRDTPNDLIFRMNYGAGGEVRMYYGRERSLIGELVGNTRIVDFANLNQADRIIINDATDSLVTSLFVFEVTGEGARDIVIADAAAGGGAGVVFLTISPRLIPSQYSVDVTLAEGQSTTRTLDVQNPGPISITWSATAPTTSWLSVAPNAGSANSAADGEVTLSINTGSLPPGVYSTTLTLASTSNDLEMAIEIPVTLTVQAARFLAVESPAPGSDLEAPFTVTGWAIDTSAPSGTGVDRVDVYAVPLSGGARTHLGTATYGGARPAVAGTYGERFRNSGFTLTVENAPGGSYRLVAEARSPHSGIIWNRAASAPAVTITGAPSSFDLNGDGFLDLVWQHSGTGAIVFWSMNGLDMVAGGALGSGTMPAGNWEVRTVADMNGDSKPDVVMQELTTGDLMVWLMNGTTLVEARPLNPGRLSDPNWRLAAAGDFNGDNKTDLIFQHLTIGHVAAWLMDGTNLLQGVALNPSQVTDVSWKIIGAGDVNGDGQADLVWQNDNTRVLTSWLMSGTTMVQGGPFTVSGPSVTEWQARGVADINGDGKVDLIWQHVTEGYVAAWLMDGQTFIDARLLNPGQVNTNWYLGGPR
jgi:hypothetical protein